MHSFQRSASFLRPLWNRLWCIWIGKGKLSKKPMKGCRWFDIWMQWLPGCTEKVSGERRRGVPCMSGPKAMEAWPSPRVVSIQGTIQAKMKRSVGISSKTRSSSALSEAVRGGFSWQRRGSLSVCECGTAGGASPSPVEALVSDSGFEVDLAQSGPKRWNYSEN